MSSVSFKLRGLALILALLLCIPCLLTSCGSNDDGDDDGFKPNQGTNRNDDDDDDDDDDGGSSSRLSVDDFEADVLAETILSAYKKTCEVNSLRAIGNSYYMYNEIGWDKTSYTSNFDCKATYDKDDVFVAFIQSESNSSLTEIYYFGNKEYYYYTDDEYYDGDINDEDYTIETGIVENLLSSSGFESFEDFLNNLSETEYNVSKNKRTITVKVEGSYNYLSELFGNQYDTMDDTTLDDSYGLYEMYFSTSGYFTGYKMEISYASYDEGFEREQSIEVEFTDFNDKITIKEPSWIENVDFENNNNSSDLPSGGTTEDGEAPNIVLYSEELNMEVDEEYDLWYICDIYNENQTFYSSSDSSVVSVSSGGVLYANGVGTAYITIRAENDYGYTTMYLDVIVSDSNYDNNIEIYFTYYSINISVGEEFDLYNIVEYSNISWNSIDYMVSDSSVAQLLGSGYVYGKQAGYAEIEIGVWGDYGFEVYDTLEVYVEGSTDPTIYLTEDSITLGVGEVRDLYYILEFDNISWSEISFRSDYDNVTIWLDNEYVTGKRPGYAEVEIGVWEYDNFTVFATLKITVVE